MVKVRVNYIDKADKIRSLKTMEFDYPKGTLCGAIPKYVFRGYEFIKTSYQDEDGVDGMTGYVVYYKWVGLDGAGDTKVIDDLKRTKYVRRVNNGIGLIVHPTSIGEDFDLAKPARNFGLVGIEGDEHVRTFIYERKEVIENMENLKELDVDLVNEKLAGVKGEISEELTDKILKDSVHVEVGVMQEPFVEDEVVETVKNEQESIAQELVEDSRGYVLGALEKATKVVRGASKEQLFAGGVVTALVVLKVLRKLVRK